MAWTSGTATDYRDLLRRLRQFVTLDMLPATERWVELRWDEQASTQELILKGPGLAGADEIFVGIRSFEDAAQGWYWWDLQGFTGYVSALPFAAQPAAVNDYPPGMSLWQYAIPYWFIANGRRIIVVAKVGTAYEHAYLGLMLPYATPVEHFYPMFVGGSMTAQTGRLRSRTDDGHRAYWHTRYYGSGTPSLNAAAMIWTAGNWERVVNGGSFEGVKTYPYCMQGLGDIGQTPGGEYLLIRVQFARISGSDGSRHTFGALDGVCYVSGHNNASENVISVSGTQWLVAQNIHRTDFYEHVALLLE